MRIVFFTRRELANPLAGGSELLVDRLAAGAAEQGHDVELVAAGPVGDRPYATRDGGGRYTQYLRAPLTYAGRVRGADLVVDVANGLSFFVPMWCRAPAICLVNHLHTEQWSQWFPEPIAALGRSLERRGIPRVYRNHLFIAVSRSTATALEQIGVGADRIRIVPNGIDLRGPSGPKSQEPLFLCLSRLVPHKRVELVLAAWERVRPRVGGRLVIVGEGPERGRLEAMAGDSVTFTGHVTDHDKQQLLGHAWLLLHPALVEGWGLVVMEAAAARTPTLAFDVPGLRDSVVHGRTGLLAPDMEAFGAAWVSLARDPAWRARLGEHARERAACFSWSSSVKQFLLVADEAVALAPVVPLSTPSAMERRWTSPS
ncbi:MAG: glycosyltransferase family 4 protein [Actinomycetota bacterium]|nr:glycosyltransferase family 4 protein [Actinomycetota bacterium]